MSGVAALSMKSVAPLFEFKVLRAGIRQFQITWYKYSVIHAMNNCYSQYPEYNDVVRSISYARFKECKSRCLQLLNDHFGDAKKSRRVDEAMEGRAEHHATGYDE